MIQMIGCICFLAQEQWPVAEDEYLKDGWGLG